MKEKLRTVKGWKRSISLLCAVMMVVSTFAHMPAILAKAAGSFTVEASETDTLEELFATGTYTEITPETFGITESVTKQTGEEQQYVYSNNVWDKKVFHGQVKFSKNDTDRIFMGHAAWCGMYFWGNGAGNISIGYSLGDNVVDCGAITVDEMNGKNLTDEYIDLAVSFNVVGDSSKGIGEVLIGIFIDGQLCEGGYLRLTGVNTEIYLYAQAMIDIRSAGSSIAIAPLQPKQYVFVEPSETDTLGELLATGNYSEVTPETFGITDVVTVSGTNQLYAPTDYPVWEDKVFHGQVKFSTNENDRIYFGHAAEYGLYLHGNAEGNISVGYKYGTKITDIGEITVEEMNGKTLTGEFIDLAVSIKITGDSSTGVGEAVFGIFIDGALCEGGYLRVTDINTEIFLYAVQKIDARGFGEGISIAPIFKGTDLGKLLASGGYTEVTPETFGIIGSLTVNKGEEQQYGLTDAWNKKVFHGRVKFSNDTTDQLFLGHAPWNGLYLWGNADGGIEYGTNIGGVLKPCGTITSAEMNNKILTDEYIDLAVSFNIVTVDDNVGEAIVGIFIDGMLCEGGYIRMSNINTAIFYHAIAKLDIRSAGTSIALASMVPELKKLYLSDFDIANGDYKYNNGDMVVSGVISGSMMNTTMTQTIILNSGDGSYICYAGLPSAWHGIHFQVDGDELIIASAAGEFPEEYRLKPEDVENKPLIGAPINLKLELYESGNDAMLRVYIDGKLYNNAPFRLTGAKDKLGGYIGYYMKNPTDTFSLEGEIPQIAKPKLTKITMKSLGIANGVYTYTKGDLVASGQHTESLMNTTMTHKITFSEHANNWFHYAGGQSLWHGIRMQTTAEGNLFIYCTESPESYTITPKKVGLDTILGKEIEFKLELFKNQDNPEDAMLGVYIDGTLAGGYYMTFSGAVDGLGGFASMYIAEQKATIQLGDLDVPTINPKYTKLGFSSYGILSGVYKYYKNDMATSGSCELASLDKVVFSDTICFSEELGAQMRIGGKEHCWWGMIFEATDDGGLKITDTDLESNFGVIKFDPGVAGGKLTGRDVELTLSFEYVDMDNDGSKDDVKLGVWFDGKAYGDRWIYIRDTANDLGSYLGIYCPNETTSLGVKTVLIPIDFAEFGFTANWAVELELKKK